MAKAGDGKREGTVGVGQGEGGRAQAEDGPGLGTGDGDAADGDAGDAAAGGALGVRDPGSGSIAEDGVGRCVSDYIAGMTDRYAIRTYEKLYVPEVWRGNNA